MKNISLASAFVLNLLSLCFVFGQTPASKPFDPLKNLVGLEKQSAPLFSKKGLDGIDYSLADLKGKIVVINLWGTSCSPCIAEMPKLNELVAKFKGKDVVFLAPSPEETPKLKKFLKKRIFKYSVLPDSFDVVEHYAPKKKEADGKSEFQMILPTHIVIDGNGLVTKHFWGFGKNTPDILSTEITRLLNNRQKNK